MPLPIIGGGFPSLQGMTGLAVLVSKLSLMLVLMTGGTTGMGDTSPFILKMTFCTGHPPMFPFKGVTEVGMVKTYLLPKPLPGVPVLTAMTSLTFVPHQ